MICPYGDNSDVSNQDLVLGNSIEGDDNIIEVGVA